MLVSDPGGLIDRQRKRAWRNLGHSEQDVRVEPESVADARAGDVWRLGGGADEKKSVFASTTEQKMLCFCLFSLESVSMQAQRSARLRCMGTVRMRAGPLGTNENL